MGKHTPISRYMTISPHSIGAEQSLARVREMMQKHGIRHLPVLHGGKLQGMISDRDVRLVESLVDGNSQLITVSDAMTPDVYAVGPDAPLDEVVEEMGTKKYGSVVVMDGAHVVGIFTTVDACLVLAEVLRG